MAGLVLSRGVTINIPVIARLFLVGVTVGVGPLAVGVGVAVGVGPLAVGVDVGVGVDVTVVIVTGRYSDHGPVWPPALTERMA